MEEQENKYNNVTIKVIGVGGAGNNALNRMYNDGLDNCELYVANTDYQVLLDSPIKNKITLGKEITKGLGAGANPEIGKQAAIASEETIKGVLREADMVFIAAGMGGGTGTGAAPVIAKICKELGILTIGIVTRPFTFEGKTRNANAVSGLQELRPYVDSLIVISNDQLLQISGNVPLKESFGQADYILSHSVKTIVDLITKPSLINLDFADVKTIMQDKGTAIIGMGKGKGTNKATDAASKAVSSPLLEAKIQGAKNAIINITGGTSMTINDAQDAVEIVRSAAEDSDINIIFGVNIDESLGDEMSVTVIATEFRGHDLHNNIHKDDNLGLGQIDRINVEDLSGEVKKEEPKVEEHVDIQEEVSKKDDDLTIEGDSFIPSFLRRRN